MTHRLVRWTFTGRDRHGDPTPITTGALEQTGRKLLCLDDDGSIAWTRSFRSIAQATASMDGDLRAMRKNDCYGWPV